MTQADRSKLLSKSPTARILIAGKPVNCLLDTGAESSLMPWEFYHDHLMKQNGSLNDVGKYLRLIGANNLEIPVAGFLETSIEVYGQKLAASFLVSDRHTTKSPSNRRDQCPVILG